MKRKFICLALIAFIVYCELFSIPTELQNHGFTLSFNKPAQDDFGFCSPDDKTQEFSGGVVFPLPSSDVEPTACIGFSYKLQSSSMVQIWFNSDQRRLDEDFRMRRIKTDGKVDTVGLNYVIGIGNDKTDAINTAVIPADYDTGASINVKGVANNNATTPVVTVKFDEPLKKHTVEYGSINPSVKVSPTITIPPDNVDVAEGFIVICMKLDEPKNTDGVYLPGQYRGYITLLYIPKDV